MKNVEYERGATSSLLPRFPALIERYRVLIFSGDVDACVCNRQFVAHLQSRASPLSECRNCNGSCVPYTGTQSWTYQVAEENNYAVENAWGVRLQPPIYWTLAVACIAFV